jgi:hypothetical protein
MKTLWFVLLLIACMAFLLMGCSDKSALITGPTDQATTEQNAAGALAKAGPVVHSATGSGHTITGTGSAGHATWFFAFSAHQYADGSFGGRVNINDHSFQVKGNFPVVYMNVDGNRALIVDYGTLPIEYGGGTWYMAYVVVDNGEGRNAPPDQHSWGLMLQEGDPAVSRLLSTTPDGFFDLIADFGLGTEEEWILTLDMGNTQVR